MKKAKAVSTKSGESVTVEEVKELTGYVDIKFLKDFGSYKKGDIQQYHTTTVKSLLSKKICEIVK